jgi:branched-chain amino acid transport system permease protein
MIGGVARPAAAMAGGLILGVLGEAANRLINPQAADWFPFVVVVVVLLLLPDGLLSIRAPLARLTRSRSGAEAAT